MADERARRASWRRRLPPTPAASPTWCLLKCAYRVTRAHHTGAVCHSAREAAATAASTRSQRADEGGAGRHSHLGRAALPPGCPAPAPEARTPPRIEWGGTTFFWGDSLQITARRTNPPAPLAPRRSLLLRFRLARPHRHPSCVRQHPLHASYGPWQRPVSAGGCGRSASDSDRALARWRSQARQARATATRLRWWWMLGATACPPRAPSRSSANSRRCRRSRIGGCSGARGCQPRPACLLHRCLPTNERPPLAGLPPRQTWFARCWASWARWAAVRASPAWRRAPLAAALLLLLVLPALAPQRTPAPTITLPCPPLFPLFTWFFADLVDAFFAPDPRSGIAHFALCILYIALGGLVSGALEAGCLQYAGACGGVGRGMRRVQGAHACACELLRRHAPGHARAVPLPRGHAASGHGLL